MTLNGPATILIFILASFGLFLQIFVSSDYNSLMAVHGNFFARIDEVSYWVSAVGHIFAHANYDHFMGNMLYLLLLGPQIEQRIGFKNFVYAVLATTIATSIAQGLFPGTALLGASGVVFMCITMSSLTANSCEKISISFVLVAALYLGKEIYNAFSPDNVSQLGHLVGGIVGIAFGYYYKVTGQVK
ncbi:rhomboid family intramembrane serine protease [Terasakiella sp. A23]|uniref:rhomboid family intramembrane serine protease n=1 Tax=Terasakiella sp. FCG-A23 TaxID=3080561 RepID=UPI0029557114|nr:rhomboid family intramembrane serine protease [Terasakiella sp. A23]MDV7339382.1 rhomboid family intramembrane serine protease [Terasakiella sp. A23]